MVCRVLRYLLFKVFRLLDKRILGVLLLISCVLGVVTFRRSNVSLKLASMRACEIFINASDPDTEKPVGFNISGAKISNFPPSLNARERYRLWDYWTMQPNLSREHSFREDKFLIYRCGDESACGGWGDRLKGILMTYVMANLTQRTFKLQIAKPDCNLADYLMPNYVNWTWQGRQYDKKNQSHDKINKIDDTIFKENVSKMNFSNLIQEQKSEVYFLANLQYIEGLRESKVYEHELGWMKAITPADVYAILYKRVFKLAPQLQRQIDDLLTAYLPTRQHRLLCAHIRLGKNPSIKRDTESRNSMENVKNVWKFLESQSNLDTDRFYIMSDSVDVIESAKQQEKFKDRLLTLPGDIVHVDKAWNMPKEKQCAGLAKVITEHHMLMNCDLLIQGHSGLSTLAAAIRNMDTDLYCFRQNGTIEVCSRNDFKTFI